MRRSAVQLGLLILLTTLPNGLTGCGSDKGQSALPTASISASASGEASLEGLADPDALIANPPASPPPRANLQPQVLIQTSLGSIRVQLDAAKAPETVDNFLENYVDRGFYDGTIFHHVENGFLVAAGGFDANLNAKAARAPIRNEATNGLKNLQGTIAMSRQADYADSATSQFFINLVDNPALDHPGDNGPGDGGDADGYCVFGKVVEGMDVVEAIAQQPVEQRGEFPNVPLQPILIESVMRIDE
jgi:peptidyl-prolyl cis-trans isomerase A (cyclophilin A)/peptidyl-prolyl cis-trans isomerase B (cyclophilin B)